MDFQTRPLVLQVITRLILGGPTRPVLASSRRLSRIGYRVVLVAGREGRFEEQDTAALRRAAEVALLRQPHLVRDPAPWSDLRALVGIRQAIRRLEPTVVHTHTAKAGALGRSALRISGKRRSISVHTFHGHSMAREVSGHRASLWRAIERQLAKNSTDLIVTLSPGQRTEIQQLLGSRAADKVVVLPLAFEPTLFGGVEFDRRAVSVPPSSDKRTLLFLGRGVRIKGLDLLARAHAQLALRDRVRASRLRVIVAGPLDGAVEQQLSQILSGARLLRDWHLVGPFDDPAALLSVSEAVALPSHSEGTPVGILEAFASGLPVIANDVGGVGELLRCHWHRRALGVWETVPCAPRGLLLPRGDLEAWTDALMRFVDDPNCLPGSPLERRAFVARTFDPQQHVSDLADLYAQLGAPQLTFGEASFVANGSSLPRDQRLERGSPPQ